ncbi:hypothetical protein Lal_00016977 [Lupinus albus]|nr:hypothetical protein Lal_00016977 [Lupinus albus]
MDSFIPISRIKNYPLKLLGTPYYASSSPGSKAIVFNLSLQLSTYSSRVNPLINILAPLQALLMFLVENFFALFEQSSFNNKYQSWKPRLIERFSPERERITWEGEILDYTGGFSPERELSRLGEKWQFWAVDTILTELGFASGAPDLAVGAPDSAFGASGLTSDASVLASGAPDSAAGAPDSAFGASGLTSDAFVLSALFTNEPEIVREDDLNKEEASRLDNKRKSHLSLTVLIPLLKMKNLNQSHNQMKKFPMLTLIRDCNKGHVVHLNSCLKRKREEGIVLAVPFTSVLQY